MLTCGSRKSARALRPETARGAAWQTEQPHILYAGHAQVWRARDARIRTEQTLAPCRGPCPRMLEYTTSSQFRRSSCALDGDCSTVDLRKYTIAGSGATKQAANAVLAPRLPDLRPRQFPRALSSQQPCRHRRAQGFVRAPGNAWRAQLRTRAGARRLREDRCEFAAMVRACLSTPTRSVDLLCTHALLHCQ